MASLQGDGGGGGGNRTRVLRRLIKASPGAACCSFLSPSVLAGKTLRAQSLFGFPTAPVTGAIGGALYRCQVPERGHIWADSSATVRQRERAGCYRHLSFCREWFSRSRDILDPLPLNRRPKSKPFTPVVGIAGQNHRTTSQRRTTPDSSPADGLPKLVQSGRHPLHELPDVVDQDGAGHHPDVQPVEVRQHGDVHPRTRKQRPERVD